MEFYFGNVEAFIFASQSHCSIFRQRRRASEICDFFMEHEWALVQEVIKLLEPLKRCLKHLVDIYELEQVKSNIVLFL